MLEKDIEARLVKECSKHGALCLKQNVVGRRGFPDRLIIAKNNRYIWVEVKTDTGKLSEGQQTAIEKLREQGCEVYVTYGLEQTLAVLEKL